MTRILFVVLLTFCSFLSLGAATPLAQLAKARNLVGPETWKMIVVLKHKEQGTAYPKCMEALVFEFNEVLWLYTPQRGTESLSLYKNNTEKDKKNLAPLFAAILPSMVLQREIAVTELPAEGEGSHLDNGCFIESIAALRCAMEGEGRLHKAALLSYYWQERGRLWGHTVLTYERGDGAYVLDPTVSKKPIRITKIAESNPVVVASNVHPGVTVAKARFFDINLASLERGLAAASSARAAVGKTVALVAKIPLLVANVFKFPS